MNSGTTSGPIGTAGPAVGVPAIHARRAAGMSPAPGSSPPGARHIRVAPAVRVACQEIPSATGRLDRRCRGGGPVRGAAGSWPGPAGMALCLRQHDRVHQARPACSGQAGGSPMTARCPSADPAFLSESPGGDRGPGRRHASGAAGGQQQIRPGRPEPPDTIAVSTDVSHRTLRAAADRVQEEDR